jgi:hypothetical protein
MNWGTKIIIVYCVFVAGILLLVFKSSNEKIDLVTPDYYAKELKYQDEINDVKRADKLSVPVSCKILNGQLMVQFPAEFVNKPISGKILLYYPADKDKDIEKSFSVTDAIVAIPVSATAHGLHEIKINWKSGNIAYRFEQKIIL